MYIYFFEDKINSRYKCTLAIKIAEQRNIEMNPKMRLNFTLKYFIHFFRFSSFNIFFAMRRPSLSADLESK